MEKIMVVDLEYQLREALLEAYAPSSASLFADVDRENHLLETAAQLAPKIWPSHTPETIAQLRDLIVDWPELLTSEPNVQALPFDYDLLPLTPLHLLHANVVELLICFGREDALLLSKLTPLSPKARQLHAAMRRRYIEQGYSEQGEMKMLKVLTELNMVPDWRFADEARPVLESLISAELIEACGSRVYRLSLPERHHVIRRYRLETRWPSYARGEIFRIMQEATTLPVLEGAH